MKTFETVYMKEKNKNRDKDLKLQIYLIDQEIKSLKKQKKVYVDELRDFEISKTKKRKENKK
jgi:hypothetical protein